MRPRFLRVHDAVRYAAISRPTLYRLIAAGKIAATKAGRTTLVEVASLDKYLDALPAAQIGTGAHPRGGRSGRAA